MADIAEDVDDALRLPEDEREGALTATFRGLPLPRGRALLRRGRKLAALSKPEFLRLFGEHGVARHSTEKAIDEDQTYARR